MAGTKSEMERLIADASKMTDIQKELNITVKDGDMSFANVAQAITVVQKKLQIYGTTEKEASSTIEGSINRLKASWQNLLTSFTSTDFSVEDEVQNVMDSLLQVLENIAPKIPIIVSSIGEALVTAFSEYMPKVFNYLKDAIGNLAKTILTDVFNVDEELIPVFEAVAGGILSIVAAIKTWEIVTKAITIAQTALNVILSLNPIGVVVLAIVGLVTAFTVLWNKSEAFRNFWISLWENIVNTTNNVINSIKSFFAEKIPNAINNFKQFLLTALENMVNAIKTFFTETIPNAINEFLNFINNIPEMIGYLLGLLIGLVAKFIGDVIQFFIDLPGKIDTWIKETQEKLLNWAINIFNNVVSWFSKTITNIINFFVELPGKLSMWLNQTLTNLLNWAIEIFTNVVNWFVETKNGIVNAFNELPEKMINIGKNILQGIWKGIQAAKDWLFSKISGFVSGFVNGIKDGLGIHSPSRVMADEIGKFIPAGIAVGIEANADSVDKAMDKLNDSMIDRLKANVDANIGDINYKSALNAQSSEPMVITRDENRTIYNTQNFYDKSSTPYEEQKEAKIQLRRLAYEL